MYEVIKRNGKKVDFNPDKISEAIKKAFEAVNREYHQSVIDLLVLRTCADFEDKIKDKKVSVEDIQDSVEKTLSDANYADVAKAYILYRKQREKARNIDNTLLDYKNLVNSYVDFEDEKNDETYSVGGLVMSNSGAITTNYWLSEIYDEQISQAHKDKDININDLNMLTGLSVLLPLKDIIEKGIIGSNGNISSAPSKHLNTLCNQLVNLLSIIQNEWAGPLCLKDFDLELSKFIKEENLKYKDVKDAIETFIYGINMPTCLGGKTPKVNIILNNGDTKEEKMINKAILEILLKGDSKSHFFKNPKFYYLVDKNIKFKDDENTNLLLEYISKHNDIYFLNRKYIEEIKDGSIGLVSIDINNIKDRDDFNDYLDKLLDIACRSLKIKKDIISKLLKNGLYPYTSKYVTSFKSLSSSIGLLNLNGDLDLIKHIKGELKKNSKKYSNEYDLVMLDDKDIKEDDIFESIESKEELLALFDEGNILSIKLKSNKLDTKAVGSLIEKIINNYEVPCFVLSNNKD